MGQISDTDAIIVAYRELIAERYRYTRITENYDLPKSITKERFTTLRTYFLDYIYPPLERRKELNDAFASLDNHIRHPDHLIRILLDSTSIIFKYGRHLPSILKAGIKALKSFRTASQLESHLVSAASRQGLTAPFTIDDIEKLIISLDQDEIEEFMNDSLGLFDTLNDWQLVSRIISIVETLIEKMKKRPKLYSAEEIKGLEIGKEIISKADALFHQLEKSEQIQLFELVYKIEKDAIEQMFENKA